MRVKLNYFSMNYITENYKNKYLFLSMNSIKRGRDFWGPSFWATIHSAAAAYKPEYQTDFVSFMNTMSSILPCDKCKVHLKTNLRTYPIENYLKNNHDLFFWTYLLHDTVNEYHNKTHPHATPKKSPQYETIKKYYFKALGEECKACQTI